MMWVVTSKKVGSFMDEEDVGYCCRCALLNSDGGGTRGAAEGLPGEKEKT